MWRKSNHKYGAKKATVDGITFDSKKECDYYCELKIRRMAGEIKDFDMQVPFEVQPPFKRNGRAIRAINYIADFVITLPDGKKQVVDVKGFRTDVYKLKKKLLLYRYPDIDFVEV